MQFAFSGERTQDAAAFLASFEHHAISIGRITDNEKLPLLVATFYGRARDWYDSLPPNQQGAYQLLVHQFRDRYFQRQSATDVREELFRLKMESPLGFMEYERNFKDLWTTWIRLRGGTEDEWFKMERFKMGLDMYFRLEANLKDPTSFQALIQVCQGYDRQVKMMNSMGDPQMTALGANLMPRANLQASSSIVHGGQVFPNVYSTTTVNPTSVYQEVEQVKSEQGTMALVNRRFDEVMAHLRQSQAIHNTIPDGGGSRGHHGVICYSCQEEGHISTRCPHRQQRGMGRGIYQVQRNGQRPNNNEVEGSVTLPMAQVPTIPHNVNLLNFIDDSDNACEVVPLKMTRASQKENKVKGESSALRQKKKSKENDKEEKLRRRHSRRKIKMEDIPMGEGVEAFNLRHELVSSGPRITWPQLLKFSPTLQKDWGRLVSIRQSRKTVHYVGIVRVEDRKDIRPTIPVSIKGFHIKDALVDSGVRVSISMDFHVISLKGPSYSLVLGRPWMQELNVVQDWSKGLMTITPSKGVSIHYDMRQQRLIEKEEDGITEYDSGSAYESDESDESEDSSSEWEMTTSYAVLKEEDDEGGLITMEQKEKMISKDLKGQERQQFINLISEFPNLFISDYAHIRGVDVIQHHINLKEGTTPVAQKLRRLGHVQKEALLKEVKALLRAQFIYPVEDSEWVSPIVVVPKKNGKWRVCVDYKPLNAATKRDHFPLPFQDEILDEIAGHEMYSVCDGYSGYFQIRIAEEDQKKTTFITPWGCFAYRCMPFGLTNAVFTFNRLAIHVFQPFFGKFVRVFMDDFAIYSSRKDHLEKVRLAFKRLEECKMQLNPEKCHIGEKEVVMLGHVVSQEGIKVDSSKIEAIQKMTTPTSIKDLEVFVQKVRYFERFIHMLAQILYPFRIILRTNNFLWTSTTEEQYVRIKELLCNAPILKPPDRTSTFFLSLSVGSHAIGAILMQQDYENRLMHPIYFISKAMSDVEKEFLEVEKWMLALIYACKKFRSFLLPHHFVIITSMSLLPYVLQHVSISARIAKWALLLAEFDFEVKLESTMRAELADLLTFRETFHEEDLVKLRKALPEPDMEDAFTLFFDGAFRKATNIAVGGIILKDPQGDRVKSEGITLSGVNSNNEAEYATLCYGLRLCKAMKIKRLILKGDSLLVIKQIQGNWKCQSDGLRNFYKEAMSLLRSFEKIQVKHVGRLYNKEADALAQAQLDKIKEGFVGVLETCKDVDSLEEVHNFLNKGEFPNNLNALQRKRLVAKASQYHLVGEDLYNKGKDGVLRRVPNKSEIIKILFKLHEEVCGGHLAHDIMIRKILLIGFTWPTIHRDVHDWCRSCDACQKAGIRHLQSGPLQPIVVFAPFEKWGIDAVGPLPKTQHGKEFILVAIDYMTKWVEAIATSSIKAKDVAQFVYKNICTRFGVPMEIVSDHGPGFRSEMLACLLSKLKIKHRYSTPYYPQANGAVEKVNGLIVKNLTKLVQDKVRTWDRYLDDTLWAYRVSYKSSTGFTPFYLVYGKEALLPIELEIKSNRLMEASHRSKGNDVMSRLASNHLLQYSREEAVEHYLNQAMKRKEAYDKKHKGNHIEEGSLVLRYDNRYDYIQGQKLDNKWEGPFVVHKKYDNGSYQLKDVDGALHSYRVNGWRLKKYVTRGPTYIPQVTNDIVDTDGWEQEVDLFPHTLFS